MSKTRTAQFSRNGKTLNVFCIVLNNGDIPENIMTDAEAAFEALAPYLKNNNQVLYIRDIPFLTIKNKYPGGYCYNQYEATIALNNWQDDEQQIKATINHELHHLVRWQNAGYGETLGGAILSEGIATYYEKLKSEWASPWANTGFSEKALAAAIEEWGSKNYNHDEWFFDGPYGEWIGYGIGYQLACQLFEDSFDLKRSVMVHPTEVLDFITKLSNGI